MSEKKKGYKARLIMVFAVFNLICILVASVSFYGMSNANLKTNYFEIVSRELKTSIQNINAKTEYVEYLAKSYIVDETFYLNMNRKYDAYDGSNVLTSYLLPKGRNMIALSTVEAEIYLYLENGTIPEHYYSQIEGRKRTFNVMNVSRIADKDYYARCKENFAYMHWEQIDTDVRDEKISLVTKLGCMAGDKEIGILIIKVPVKEIIRSSLPKTDKEKLFYEVCDENGNVLEVNFDKTDSRFCKKFNENKIEDNLHNKWKLAIYMPVSNIALGRRQILQFILILDLALFICYLIIGKHMAERMYKNVGNILSGLDIYKRGEYDHRIFVDSDDEFKEIAESINGFVTEIQYLIDDVYEGMIQRQDIEFQMLRAKINPHFLCNIFNLVAQLAESGNNDEIITLSQKTSSFYRRILKKNDSYARVMDEKNALEDYFGIMDIIKSKSITREWDIESRAERCIIPAFILQPVVENSIRHGMIENSIDIKISVRICDDLLVITISDNGCGMTPEQCGEMFKIKQNGGYGLYNIRSRIKLKYPGERYGMFASSEQGKGTEVKLVFPVSYENEEEL